MLENPVTSSSAREFPIYEAPEVRLHGRSSRVGDVFHMDWTGNAVEILFRGSGASILLFADNTGKEQWILVEVDGNPSVRIRLENGTHWYTLLDTRGHCDTPELVRQAVRHIIVYKETQAHYGADPATTAAVSLRIDGELLPLPARRRVEYIGDSITSGEGTLSPALAAIGSYVSVDEWSSFYYSWEGYATRSLNVDWQVVSQGGWGVYCGWDNNLQTAIPSVYDQNCGIIREPYAAARGASAPYDFHYDPDLVLVNLCTNDNSAFFQPPWVHPETGISHKQHRVNENADPQTTSYEPADAARVRDAIVVFVRRLAEKNPRAHIFWLYGMMGQNMWPVIESAALTLRELGYDRFHTLYLPQATANELGANSHPLAAAHRRAAECVVEALRPYLQ